MIPSDRQIGQLNFVLTYATGRSAIEPEDRAIQKMLDATMAQEAAVPEQRQFPVVRDTKANIERLTREAVYLRFGGKSAATAYFVDLASQVDVAILRDQISEEVGATLKKTIDRLAARKIAQGAQKAAKTREERVQAKQEAARSKAEKKALQQ